MHKILIGIVKFASFLSFFFSISLFPFMHLLFFLILLFSSRISKVNSSDVKILDSVEQTFRRIVKQISSLKKKVVKVLAPEVEIVLGTVTTRDFSIPRIAIR